MALLFRISPAHGVVNQGGAAGDLKLFFDLEAVHIHGFGADVEVLGDFFSGFSLADEAEDFELAVGEFLER